MFATKFDRLTEADLSASVLSWFQAATAPLLSREQLEQAFNFATPRSIFLKTLPLGSRVLDLGAGEGSLVHYLNWPLFERKDIKLHALSLTKGPFYDKYESYELKNFEDNPADVFRGLSFDAIICSHFIEHMRDPMPAINFMRTKLATGGRLYIEWPHPMSTRMPSRFDLIRAGHNVSTIRFTDDPTHVNAYPAHEILKLLADRGFTVETGGRVYLSFLADELRNRAKASNDETLNTMGVWAAFAWAQYMVAGTD